MFARLQNILYCFLCCFVAKWDKGDIEMKKLHIVFCFLAVAMTLTAIVTALVLFVNTAGDPYTGFPAWAAFYIVGIYYAIGLAILVVAWLCSWLVFRYMTCKKNKKVL